MIKWHRPFTIMSRDEDFKKDPEQDNDVPVPDDGSREVPTDQGESFSIKMHLQRLKPSSDKCCDICSEVYFVVLCLTTVLASITVIAVTVSCAMASKFYNTEQSGRLVAMIMLAATAAVTLAVTIYGTIGLFKKHRKPLHAAAIILVIITIIQVVIIVTSVRVTNDDELDLGRSLVESFDLNLEHNPRHVKLWAMTQHDLACCGVYGPEDYRSPELQAYFAPDIPISCCPTFDPDRSELVQERDRIMCRGRKSYYDNGCKNLVIELFNETSVMVLSVTLVLIGIQVIQTISIIVAYKRMRKDPGSDEEDNGKTERK